MKILFKKATAACLGLFIIIFSIWGAVAPLLVYALPPALLKAKTIGELIVTLFAASGTAITNTTVVPGIYSAYDSSYYSLESMVSEGILEPVDSSIDINTAIAELGTGNKTVRPFNLNAEAFRDYVKGNWQKMIDLQVDAVLRFDNIANADSTYGAIDNLGQLLLDVANYGYLGASNSIAVIANPGSVVQVSLEKVLDTIKKVFSNNLTSNQPINIKSYSGINPELQTIGIVVDAPNYHYMVRGYGYDPEEFIACVYVNGNVKSVALKNVSGGYAYLYPWVQYNPNSETEGVYGNYDPIRVLNGQIRDETFTASTPLLDFWGSNVFQNRDSAIAYLNSVQENPELRNYGTNKDLVNQDQGNITNPSTIQPLIQGDEGIEIIPSEAYEDFLADASEDPGSQNAVIMDEFVNPYITPDFMRESWENPDIPGTNPINPAQPTIAPKPTPTPEDIEDVNVPIVPNIQEVFPFCIPWDILDIIKGLDIERQAPEIEWRFKVDRIGLDYTFDIDLSEYDEIAAILRTMELLLFIVGLAIVTRNLIGA